MPVLRRPTANGSSRRRAASAFEGASPMRPPSRTFEADVDAPAEEGADGQHDGARARSSSPSIVTTPAARPFAHDEVGDFGFAQREVRLRLEQRADRLAIERAVGLGAGRAHGRALARVQRAELDAGAVGGDRHRAAHGVDLAHEVALADAADRRVAAHLADGREALRHEQRARTHPGRREGRLGAGVAAADDDDVVRSCPSMSGAT